MIKKQLVAICLCLLAAVPLWGDESGVTIAQWYGNAEAAITYTFDDGLQEHYTMVFPQLKKRNMQATFCVIGSKVGRDQKGTPCMTWEQLREMADAGMEISSHGYQHKNVTTLSGEALRYEVEHNDSLIYNKVGRLPLTYCYPGNRKTDSLVAIVEQGRVGSRTFQVSLGSKRDSLWCSRWLQRTLKKRAWDVAMTHGITTGYDHFDDANMLWHHFDEAARLRDEGRLWIATLRDVLAYQQERSHTTLDVQQKGGRLTITAHCTLPKERFCHPLTIVVDGQHYDIQPHGGQVIVKR